MSGRCDGRDPRSARFEWAAISEVAQFTQVIMRRRCSSAPARLDAGARPGTTTEESAELKRLRRDNAELRRANAT